MTYSAPFWAINEYFETIVPALFRPVPNIKFEIELFDLPDSDVVQLNWLRKSNDKVVILVPGLESNSTRSYIKNFAHYLHLINFDIAVLDHRGCLIPNKVFRSYHSGNTEDLHALIESKKLLKYKRVFLAGFSLGGNIVLKYLGETKNESKIYKAAAICAPSDLVQCSRELGLPKNRIFSNRFVKSLKKSLILKNRVFPGKLSTSEILACKTIWDVDDLYTAPAHGFRDALDYYSQCSSKNFIKQISIPTLLINAKNDPMIPVDNGMIELFHSNSYLHPVITDRGGHLGYPTTSLQGPNFYEKKVIDFFCS